MDKPIILDGREMTSKEKLHDYLKKRLNLPDYYGRNLDALKDCLTTDYFSRTIKIYEANAIKENLGRYGENLLSVFQDAAEENASLEVHIKNTRE